MSETKSWALSLSKIATSTKAEVLTRKRENGVMYAFYFRQQNTSIKILSASALNQ
jgi:hypothetical protein